MDDRYNYTPGGMPPVAGQPGTPPPPPQDGYQQPQPYNAPIPTGVPAPTPTLAQAQKPTNQLVQTAVIISLALISAIAIGMLVWMYVRATDAETNVDGRIAEARAAAAQEQRDIDEANFSAREKLPNLEFTGPDDYGRLSFMYPRTWSVYVNQDAAKGGAFEAYLNPRVVGPIKPVSGEARFALRVTIYDRPYDDVVKSFDSLVKNNSLTSNVFQVGDNTGIRLDGAFSKDITGSAVLLKINDKTVYIRTDTEATRPDFETLIQTIRFN